VLIDENEAQTIELTSIESKLDEWIGPLVEVIDSKIDTLYFGVKILTSGETITESGVYILVDDIQCPITVDSDNVTIDLKGFDICGTCTAITINPNKSNVVIKNGGLVGAADCAFTCSAGSQFSGAGISVGEGAQLVDIENMTIFGYNRGVSFNGTAGNQIRSSEVKDTTVECNNIGFYAENTIKTEFDNAKALNSYEAGFYQVDSSYNTYRNSDAIMTQNDDPTKRAIGFASIGGFGNLYDGVLAEGIKTTTGALSYGAIGFLLEGDERESKIINSIANSTQVDCATAIAYGIKLSGVYNDLTLTYSYDTQSTVNAVEWTSDVNYMAVGGTSSGIDGDEVRVLGFNDCDMGAMSKATFDHGATVNDVAWTSDGGFLAVGGENPSDGNELRVLSFDGISLSALDGANYDHGATIHAVDWIDDCCISYLAIGGNEGTGDYEVRVFVFDTQYLEEIETARYSHGSNASVRDVKWSHNGQYLAIAGTGGVGGYEVRVLKFSDLTLYDLDNAVYDHGATVQSIAWSHNGNYLAIVGENGTGGYELRVLRFSCNELTDISGAVYDSSVAFRSVSWSPNSEYLTVGTDSGTNEVLVFSFDGSNISLVEGYDHGATVNSVHWSENGKYIVSGGANGNDDADVRVFNVMDYPSRVLIDNNKVNSTIGCINGVGISGASGTNTIIQNIASDNNVNYSSGVSNISLDCAAESDVDNVFKSRDTAEMSAEISEILRSIKHVSGAIRSIEKRLNTLEGPVSGNIRGTLLSSGNIIKPGANVITTSGLYRLVTDTHGFVVIDANDVIIDFNGFTLSYDTAGPVIKILPGCNNIEIKDSKFESSIKA